MHPQWLFLIWIVSIIVSVYLQVMMQPEPE